MITGFILFESQAAPPFVRSHRRNATSSLERFSMHEHYGELTSPSKLDRNRSSNTRGLDQVPDVTRSYLVHDRGCGDVRQSLPELYGIGGPSRSLMRSYGSEQGR